MTDEEIIHLAQNDKQVDRVDSDSDEEDIGERVSYKKQQKPLRFVSSTLSSNLTPIESLRIDATAAVT